MAENDSAVHWTQTEEGRAKMRRLMKKRWKKGEFTGNTHQTPAQTQENGGKKANVSYGRTLYSLAKHVRSEIHSHVRHGGELESLHTSMLALTDALMKHHEGDGE